MFLSLFVRIVYNVGRKQDEMTATTFPPPPPQRVHRRFDQQKKHVHAHELRLSSAEDDIKTSGGMGRLDCLYRMSGKSVLPTK